MHTLSYKKIRRFRIVCKTITLIIKMKDSFVKLFETVNTHRERKLDRNQMRIIPRTRFDLKYRLINFNNALKIELVTKIKYQQLDT